MARSKPRKTFRSVSAVVWKTTALLCLALVGLIGMARLQGYQLLSVQSNSMAPYVGTGDALIIDAAAQPALVSDIVSYASPRNPQVILTHRIISIDRNQGTFVAKGDNAALADPPAPLQTIIGHAVQPIPYAGRFLDIFRHPLGLAAAVYLPAAGIVLSEVRRLSKHFSGLGVRRYIIHPALRKI